MLFSLESETCPNSYNFALPTPIKRKMDLDKRNFQLNTLKTRSISLTSRFYISIISMVRFDFKCDPHSFQAECWKASFWLQIQNSRNQILGIRIFGSGDKKFFGFCYLAPVLSPDYSSSSSSLFMSMLM